MTGPDRHRQPSSRPGHRLSKAVLDIPLRAVAGWRGPAGEPPGHALPPALPAALREIGSAAGRLSYYSDVPASRAAPPLLLIHSINAAGSAYEVGPIFQAFRGHRPVYALDLPGFGFSERSRRLYTPRLMTDAILAMVDEIRRHHGDERVDALALSLSSEFLARAASERPERFRSLAFVSPTGFDSRAPRNGPPGSTRAMPTLHRAFTFGLWREGFFKLLTSRVSIRYFLEKTWGAKTIDEGMLEYDYLTTHQPGAEHAPYCFISGYLFSNDITRVYEQLTLPVWMVHGMRGDFTDYSYKGAFETRPNWTIQELPTGALPHFELPDTFLKHYETFLNRGPGGPQDPGAGVGT